MTISTTRAGIARQRGSAAALPRFQISSCRVNAESTFPHFLFPADPGINLAFPSHAASRCPRYARVNRNKGSHQLSLSLSAWPLRHGIYYAHQNPAANKSRLSSPSPVFLPNVPRHLSTPRIYFCRFHSQCFPQLQLWRAATQQLGNNLASLLRIKIAQHDLDRQRLALLLWLQFTQQHSLGQGIFSICPYLAHSSFIPVLPFLRPTFMGFRSLPRPY